MWSFETVFSHLAYCFGGSSIVAYISISLFFFFIAKCYSDIGICHILFLQSSVDGHWGAFHCFVDRNAVAVGIHAASVWVYVSPPLGIGTRSRFAGSVVNVCLTLKTFFLVVAKDASHKIYLLTILTIFNLTVPWH